MNHLPFYVITNERTERFATLQAAQLFMELHTASSQGNNQERVLRTNAHTPPLSAEGVDTLHRAIKHLRQLHMNCRTWALPAGDAQAIDLMFDLVD